MVTWIHRHTHNGASVELRKELDGCEGPGAAVGRALQAMRRADIVVGWCRLTPG